MAKDTPIEYRNLVIYQVYVRNHSPEGTFEAVEADLERIRSMGVDVVYFMPIHPIGQLNKKGTLGCPYSISDYRAVNPEYGTLADFQRLVERTHALGMKVMIDVVYNHTSHDSVLVSEHPEWFHQDERGMPVTTVPEWSDVIDLKHPNPALTAYLIDTLRYWVQMGVDGFRCDVASLLPVEFWEQARAGVAQVRPGIIWLAESVHVEFIIDRRINGLFAVSDSELYRAFDLLYDYDIWPCWQHAVKGSMSIQSYLDLLRFQDGIYPENFVKIRCAENHDQPRIMDFAPSREQALAWSALMAFNKGPFFIYTGQEAGATQQPSLFDIDKVDWKDFELQDFITHLSALKKHTAQRGRLIFTNSDPLLQACWFNGEQSLMGIFNLGGQRGESLTYLEDGVYLDLLSGEQIPVQGQKMAIPQSAWILECSLKQPLPSYRSPILTSEY